VEFWTLAIPHEVTASDAHYIQKTLAVPKGAHLLDVPCGNGRHSIELARRGYRMTGVDLSHEFLEIATKSGAAVEWQRGDMRDLHLPPEAFDGAFCFGNSFCYLNYENAHAFLSSVAKALRPGARMIVETGTAAETILPALLQKRWHRTGDILTSSECRYAAEASRMDIDYTFIQNGVVETRPSSSYVFTAAEIARMFDRAGFAVESMHGSTAGDALQLGSRGLLVTGIRR